MKKLITFSLLFSALTLFAGKSTDKNKIHGLAALAHSVRVFFAGEFSSLSHEKIRARLNAVGECIGYEKDWKEVHAKAIQKPKEQKQDERMHLLLLATIGG